MSAKRNLMPDRDEAVISLRIPRGQYDELRAIAAKEQRSIAGEVRRLILIRLEEAQLEAAA